MLIQWSYDLYDYLLPFLLIIFQLAGDVYVHDHSAIRVGNATCTFSTGYATPIRMRKTTE